MYCYLEFKLRYLKNLKLFSIRVKELSEPIVLQLSTVVSFNYAINQPSQYFNTNTVKQITVEKSFKIIELVEL